MNKLIQRGLAASTALAFGTALALGGASSAHATETWSISSLALTNPVVIDANATAGDDDGFLAVTKQFLILDGQDTAFTYDLTTLADGAATDIPVSSNTSIVTDLKSNISYQLVIDLVNDSLTGLVALDDNGNVTTTTVTLSSPIALHTGGFMGLMSGFGYVAVWNGDSGNLKIISPDGTVTSSGAAQYFLLSPTPASNGEGSDYFETAGVGEFDGTNYWFVGTDVGGNIYRWDISSGAGTSVQVLDNVDNHSDSDTFMISTCSNKFYIHTENIDAAWTSFFGQDITGMEEPLLSADATFSSAGDCAAAPDPELPNTGIDAGAGLALSAVLAGLGAAAFIVVRRRQVASK